MSKSSRARSARPGRRSRPDVYIVGMVLVSSVSGEVLIFSFFEVALWVARPLRRASCSFSRFRIFPSVDFQMEKQVQWMDRVCWVLG